jgi:hypothetical protein
MAPRDCYTLSCGHQTTRNLISLLFIVFLLLHLIPWVYLSHPFAFLNQQKMCIYSISCFTFLVGINTDS